MSIQQFKRIVLGHALSSEALQEEKLSRFWGLPIMASDAVSSVAYAVEEILMALVPVMGILAVQYVGLVSLPIIALLVLLIFSYTQIINHYPSGGGAYIVSHENFGRTAALLAAACLIVDYIMTVAVSISSSTAAIVAAMPQLAPYRVVLSIVCVGFITLINLRGASESSKIFGVPTYAFIVLMAVLIVTGFVRFFSGTLAPIAYTEAQRARLMTEAMQGMTLVLFLRAFSAGCSALTGVEAVSNAIPSFKEPSQRTAKHVLFLLGGVIVFIFGGISFLATVVKVVPLEGSTVMSQMAFSIFGNGVLYYLIQFATSLILLLAANTAYSGLPTLLSILAKDRFMPRQLAQSGTRISFSNGIFFIFLVSSLLLAVFQADTHRLIPFYAVGVFVSFTVSQAGMFVKWMREKDKGWQYKSLINGFGALVTLVGSVVVFVTKFTHGAWMLLVAIPLLMYFMHTTHVYYTAIGKDISLEGVSYTFVPSKSHDKLPCVVLVHNMNKATLKTLDYANDVSSDVTAIHVSTSPRHTQTLCTEWEARGIEIPLVVLDAPYRDILQPLEQYIAAREATLPKGGTLTVVLTKFVGQGWRDMLYHNQTAFFLARTLGRHEKVATTLVPFVYRKQ